MNISYEMSQIYCRTINHNLNGRWNKLINVICDSDEPNGTFFFNDDSYLLSRKINDITLVYFRYVHVLIGYDLFYPLWHRKTALLSAWDELPNLPTVGKSEPWLYPRPITNRPRITCPWGLNENLPYRRTLMMTYLSLSVNNIDSYHISNRFEIIFALMKVKSE